MRMLHMVCSTLTPAVEPREMSPWGTAKGLCVGQLRAWDRLAESDLHDPQQQIDSLRRRSGPPFAAIGLILDTIASVFPRDDHLPSVKEMNGAVAYGETHPGLQSCRSQSVDNYS